MKYPFALDVNLKKESKLAKQYLKEIYLNNVNIRDQ